MPYYAPIPYFAPFPLLVWNVSVSLCQKSVYNGTYVGQQTVVASVSFCSEKQKLVAQCRLLLNAVSKIQMPFVEIISIDLNFIYCIY